MAKKLVILDSRIYRLPKIIQKIRNDGIEIKAILICKKSKKDYKKDYEKHLMIYPELKNFPIEWVTFFPSLHENIYDVPVCRWRLDELYEEPDTVFLFNIELDNDGSQTFDEMFSVGYTREKIAENDGENDRFFLYTLAPSHRDILARKFKEKQITASADMSGCISEMGYDTNKDFAELFPVLAT